MKYILQRYVFLCVLIKEEITKISRDGTFREREGKTFRVVQTTTQSWRKKGTTFLIKRELLSISNPYLISEGPPFPAPAALLTPPLLRVRRRDYRVLSENTSPRPGPNDTLERHLGQGA